MSFIEKVLIEQSYTGPKYKVPLGFHRQLKLGNKTRGPSTGNLVLTPVQAPVIRPLKPVKRPYLSPIRDGGMIDQVTKDILGKFKQTQPSKVEVASPRNISHLAQIENEYMDIANKTVVFKI